MKRLKERFAYWFDNYMASGAWSIFLALLIIFVGGFILLAAGRVIVSHYMVTDGIANSDAFWRIFLELTDPGNMNQDNAAPWMMKIFAVLSGIFGIIFFSAVIAFITTQLDLKLEALKKGRSRVMENDHTLILGWNDEMVEIIRELIIANESEAKAQVVILSNTPKEEMDDYIGEHITDRKTTKIITRTGEPGSINSLKRVSVETCKSIIVLPTCTSFGDMEEKSLSDARTLKTLLAVAAATRGEEEPPSIVTQIFSDANKEIMQRLIPDNLTVVDPEDMVAKIAVQTSRSTGLAAVYSSLIGFDGCEFYITESDWNGMPFGDVHFHYPDGIAIGIRDGAGEIFVNPPHDRILKDDDSIIILAEDDSTIKFKPQPLFTPGDLPLADRRLETAVEKELIIGWNNKGPILVDQYTDYILEGSSIDILLPPSLFHLYDEIKELNNQYKDHKINVIKMDTLNIKGLSSIEPETYNSVIILNSIEDDVEKADAHTISTLLLLREAIRQREENSENIETQIITEVMNSDNLELITHTGVKDAIISTKMVSKILAQIAEEPDILKVYEDIFTEEGSEIYLKPLSLYLDSIPEEMTFADLIKLTQKRNEICLGYRVTRDALNVKNEFGVIINPPKGEKISLTMEDSLIVVAEDEL